MLSSLRNKWRMISRISADPETRRQVMRLGLRRYSYPGFALLRRFLAHGNGVATCTLNLRAHGSGAPVQLTLRLADAGDVASFFENWIESPPPFEECGAELRLVVDAGAHIGCYSLMLHSLYPECDIVAFEPNRNNGEILRKNFEDNEISGNIIAAALWHEDLESLFMVEGASNAGFASATKSETGEAGYSVPGKTLTSVLDDKIKQLDLVKLDIEGAEYEVLPGILNNVPTSCAVWMELHDVAARPGWLDGVLAGGWKAELYDSFPPHEMWLLRNTGSVQ